MCVVVVQLVPNQGEGERYRGFNQARLSRERGGVGVVVGVGVGPKGGGGEGQGGLERARGERERGGGGGGVLHQAWVIITK